MKMDMLRLRVEKACSDCCVENRLGGATVGAERPAWRLLREARWEMMHQGREVAGFETYAKVDGTIFAHEMAVREREYLLLCFLNTHFSKSAAGGRAVSWERGQWLVGHWGGRKLFAWPVGGRSVDLDLCQEAWLFKRNVVEVS